MVFNLRCYTNFPFHTQLVSSNIYDCTCLAKTHAIFVPNLPMNATVEQLEAVFNNFWPIKHNGIQVRSSKQQGTCFGLVEFESSSLMQSAIEQTITEGGFQDGLVIKMITLRAVETSVVGILVEDVAMGEMDLRGEVISQIKLMVMLDGMKKLSIGSTKMVEEKPHAKPIKGA